MKSIIDEANKESKYVGSFPNMPAQAILSLAPPNDYESTPSINLFLATYQAVPCVLLSLASNGYERLHATTIVDYLRDELNHDLENDHIMTTYNHKNDDLSVISRCCDLGNGVMIDMGSIHLNSNVSNPNKLKPDESDNSFLITSRFCIYFLPGKRKYVQDLAQKITKMTVTEIEPLKSFTLHMVCKNINGYYLSCITIKKPLITDLGLHYGQKFVSIHNKIIEALNKKEEKGIVFLHGIPGSGKLFYRNILFSYFPFVETGKTHYIRYLIHEIEDKTLIYIPPDMAKEISAPDFLPFLMQYPNSILIIEDAENIIKDRSESSIPSQAVANLLNLYVKLSE